MEETSWNVNIQENFDIFGAQNYFENVPRKALLPGYEKYLKEIEEFLKQFKNPISYIDGGIQDFIKELLIALVGQTECNTGTATSNPTKNITNSGFTWSRGNLDIFQEGFSIQETPNLVATIQSFLTNHPSIKNETALIHYYITQLNNYEKMLGSPPTADQVFAFNQAVDNQLATSEALSTIDQIAKSLPNPSYPNTLAGYQSFLKNDARFSFDNTDSLSYYAFQQEYFPYPTNLSGFENELQDTTDPNFNQNINQFLTQVQTSTYPPLLPQSPTTVDPNYAFSINIQKSHTDSIQHYLEYISEWFAFIVYKNQPKGNTMSYSRIEANICMTYIQLINAVEFQKYRIYSTFLTPYEIAIFNHLFFICLNQDMNRSNVYNLSMEGGQPQNGSWTLTQTVSSPYINLLPLNVTNMMNVFTSEINQRVSYLSAGIITNGFQPLPLDGEKIISLGPNAGTLLSPYLLDTPIQPTQNILDYFVPVGLSECDQNNANLQKECDKYAHTIKQELYRLFTIPIILYIVYNFYFLFFFKDCLSPTQTTDETGKNTYKHTCETGEKGGCFTPIFPDWETIFHSIESHNTDYFFQFVFKPVKLYYTFLNAFKGIFRKDIADHVIKDDVPYLFFLLTFFFIYRFIEKHGQLILNTLQGLMKFQLPEVPFMGKNALASYAKGIMLFCLICSFLKRTFIGDKPTFIDDFINGKETPDASGVTGTAANIAMDMATNAFSKIGGGDTSKQSWMEWLGLPTSALLFVVKCICFILYWLFKFMITIAMIPLAITIFTLYFLWNTVFGILQYTTPIHNVGSKIDLMYRIMYTKLCDNKEDGLFKYIAKSVIFFCIYLIVELIILHKLYKGASSFLKMPTAFIPNMGLNPGQIDVNKTNLSVKTAMIFLYGILFLCVVLWCIYKINFKMPFLVSSYKEHNDDTTDKRFHYDCIQKDIYEEKSNNSFMKILISSDDLNKSSMEEFKRKTTGIKKPSMVNNMIKRIGEIGSNISGTITEKFQKMQENSENAVEKRHELFGKMFGSVSQSI
jgi:hypothetical protein